MKEKGIIALDGMNFAQSIELASTLSHRVWGFKAEALLHDPVGSKRVIEALLQHGHVFADAKTHRIPSTAAEEVGRLASYGADLITVHASGGLHAKNGLGMLPSVVEAYKKHGPPDGLGILAITALTSLGEEECFDIYGDIPSVVVERFARFADEAGAHGIVCSAQELVSLQGKFPRLKRATPGLRSLGQETHDQARVDTPGNAVRNGAHLLVIGRQVTGSSDPVAAVEALDKEITEAENGRT